MNIEIKKASDFKPAEAISILYYGGSGVGKTWFCGTAGDSAYIIDCGVGPIETLNSVSFKERHSFDPKIIVLREELDKHKVPQGKAFDELCKIMDYLIAGKDEFGVETICIDNATAVRSWAMIRGLVLSGTRSQTTVTKDKPFVVPAIQDFGMEMTMIEWFINTYVDLCKNAGIHFILTAHERQIFEKTKTAQGKPIVGELDTLKWVKPGFTGKTFPDDVPALFDEVWHAERAGGRSYRFKPYGDDIITAKTTHGSGILKSLEDDPCFVDILQRIKDRKKPEPIRRKA